MIHKKVGIFTIFFYSTSTYLLKDTHPVKSEKGMRGKSENGRKNVKKKIEERQEDRKNVRENWRMEGKM